MPNRPGNDDRITATGNGGDRSAQRDVTNDPARQNASQGSLGGNGQRTRSNRGFASMDRSKQKEIASKGGKAAHAKGTAHEFDSGEAREAGRKGGMAVSRNREHMAAIGRRGGEARGHARARANSGAQVNSGNSSRNLEGSFQNSRSNTASSDRQVAIDSQNDGVNTSTQGNRGGNNSLGGERRTTNDSANQGESFGNR